MHFELNIKNISYYYEKCVDKNIEVCYYAHVRNVHKKHINNNKEP